MRDIFADNYLFPKKNSLINSTGDKVQSDSCKSSGEILQMGRLVNYTVGMAAQFTGYECLPLAFLSF